MKRLTRAVVAVARIIAVKVLPAFVSLAVLAAIIAWMSGAFETKIEPGRQPVARQAPMGAATVKVEEVIKDYVEEAVGTLKAAERTNISSKVLGRISEIRVQADDLVEQGQVLVTLDDGELRSRVQQSRETLNARETTREKAERQFGRVQALQARNAVTKEAFDEAAASLMVARADERRARLAIEEATVLLSYAEITSPRAGRIIDRFAEPGEMAVPGEPLLALYDQGSLRLEVPVMESLALRMSTGDEVTVRIDALDRELRGTVDLRVPQAEAASRTFLVKVTIPSSEDLYEGMFGRLLIPAGRRAHLCLPESAVRNVGQLELVDVVGADGTLELRYVKTGRRGLAGKVEVLSGLEAGEVVLLHEPSPAAGGSGS